MHVQLYSLRITLLQRFTFHVKPTNLLLPRPPRRSSQPTPMYTSIALNLGQNVALCNLITLCIWFQFICRLVAFKAHHFRILYQCCISLHCTASLAQNVTLHQPTKPPTHPLHQVLHCKALHFFSFTLHGSDVGCNYLMPKGWQLWHFAITSGLSVCAVFSGLSRVLSLCFTSFIIWCYKQNLGGMAKDRVAQIGDALYSYELLRLFL